MASPVPRSLALAPVRLGKLESITWQRKRFRLASSPCPLPSLATLCCRSPLFSSSCHQRRYFLGWGRNQSAVVPDWSGLSAQEQEAWTALGWSTRSWATAWGKGSGGVAALPATARQKYEELSQEQQAIVKYGLKKSQEEWNELINKLAQKLARPSSSSSSPAPVASAGASTPASSPSSPPSTLSSSLSALSTAAYGALKTAAPLLTPILSQVRHPAAKMALAGFQIATAMAPQVTVRGIETILYLDDSGSMSGLIEEGNTLTSILTQRTKLNEGQKALASLGDMLQDGPVRTVKFGSEKYVLSDRTDPKETGGTSFSPAVVNLAWDGTSGGTYMWHMIEQDVLERYKPGGGVLRLVVITDGEDIESPPPYNGMRGMDALMKSLKAKGFDVQWHIIVLGRVPNPGRYNSLAAATGGSFLAIGGEFKPQAPEAKAFLQNLRKSDSAALERRQRQKQYEIEARNGSAEKFDWYQAFPPPKD
eukprot:g27749.t1